MVKIKYQNIIKIYQMQTNNQNANLSSQGSINNLMPTTSIQQFKKNLGKDVHYSIAFIDHLVNFINSQKSLNTYQEIYELINKQSEQIISFFMNHSNELELIQNKNPLCFNSIKEYFLKILRIVHKKYGKDIPKFKQGLKVTNEQFKNVLGRSTQKIVENAEVIATDPGMKKIMVYSYSKSVARSIKRISKTLQSSLEVYVCRSGLLSQGMRMFKQLIVDNIKVKLINDNEIQYYMNEVSMVISGAEVILENGSILNRTGTSSLALIAYSNNKPFYVFAESYKYLKRIYFSQSDLPKLIKKDIQGNSIILNDLTQSKYITLFFTDIGVFTPEVVSLELANMFQ